MKIKTRVLSGFFILSIIIFYFLIDLIGNEIRPRYLETVEESLNDTVNILASMIEADIKHGKINLGSLQKVFPRVNQRQISAKIYGVEKHSVNVKVYVTDKKGLVIYDSHYPENVGKDFSKWNDVYLTLRGKYGARSTSIVKNDYRTSSIYLAAPLRYNNKIIGVVTAIKPKESIQTFIELAQQKVLIVGVLTCIVIIFMSYFLSIWINKPVRKLVNYVKDLKGNKIVKLPYIASGEIKELGVAFDELREELEGRKYIENYIQTMTHEIKSPLSSIRGAAELLEEEVPDAQKRLFYKNILKESVRIEKIIQRLLELSSLENRKELKSIEMINLKELVNSVIHGLSSQLLKKELLVENNFQEKNYLFGEHFLIKQVINNILQNSIRFSTSGTSITINPEETESHIVIKINNRGELIPEYAQDKIYDKFYSLPDSKSKKKSSGLGLAFVKEVAILHNGWLKVQNNQSKNGVISEIAFAKKT